MNEPWLEWLAPVIVRPPGFSPGIEVGSHQGLCCPLFWDIYRN
jgi:hypothetical protein